MTLQEQLDQAKHDLLVAYDKVAELKFKKWKEERGDNLYIDEPNFKKIKRQKEFELLGLCNDIFIKEKDNE